MAPTRWVARRVVMMKKSLFYKRCKLITNNNSLAITTYVHLPFFTVHQTLLKVYNTLPPASNYPPLVVFAYYKSSSSSSSSAVISSRTTS